MAICALALFAGTPFANAATCTPTGFSRDAINLTAALINPPGKVTGDVDATGCNIGVYYGPGAQGKVDQANVHGANYFGVVNNGADVDITDSSISDIGEKPFNGGQHGVAIYFAFGSASEGDIKRNMIWNYQKGGIVVNGPLATSEIEQNHVIGLGPVNFIAQNGIQAGYGSHTKIRQNFVTGNSYTGTSTVSGGIILVGGACYGGDPTTDTEVEQNVVLNNDVGIWLTNLDASCNAVTTPTRDRVKNNAAFNNAVNNTVYQAGIADQGDMDVIENNDTCGLGYTPPAGIGVDADVSFTNNPVVKNNTICSSGEHGEGHHGGHHGGMRPHAHR